MSQEITPADLDRPVGDDDELSILDKKLLDMANQNLSMQEMSDKLGIATMTPERCGARLKELLNSRNFLNPVEKLSLLMMDMVELKDILFQRVREEGGFKVVGRGNSEQEVWSDGDPRWSANLIRLFKEFRAMVEQSAEMAEKTRDKVREGHAQLMFIALRAGFERFVFELNAESELGEVVTYTRMLELMENALILSNSKIEERVSH